MSLHAQNVADLNSQENGFVTTTPCKKLACGIRLRIPMPNTESGVAIAPLTTPIRVDRMSRPTPMSYRGEVGEPVPSKVEMATITANCSGEDEERPVIPLGPVVIHDRFMKAVQA